MRLFLLSGKKSATSSSSTRYFQVSTMDDDDGMYRPALDMSHGFVKEIIKNQIDRDEYHRLMEERKEEYKNEISKETKISSREPSRPAPAPMPAHIYVPPHRRRAAGESGSSGSKRRALAPSSPASGMISDREELRIRQKHSNRLHRVNEARRRLSSG